MYKLYIVTIIFFGILSCKDIQKNVSNEFQVKTDSLTTELKKAKVKIKTLKSKLCYSSSKVFNNENFDSFFWKFMTDSTFQISRINFPLKYISWKESIGGEIDTIGIKKAEWEYDLFYLNTASERTQIYDNFELNLRPSNERLLHWYGVETGGDVKYYFEGFNGKMVFNKKRAARRLKTTA
ncbi:DUF4348 domain-containing protein [Aestuariivivens marinum]|uniref:DUF4348 domain-containing protein n=1 Tax=Aestuariivivens marinum TaxID=2913555 RepID=UPI001F5A9434|nr:DUF4348 domain-containing protein [Aestuariivivens marinum]